VKNKRPTIFQATVWFTAFVMLIALIPVLFVVFTPATAEYRLLVDTRLQQSITNTVLLLIGVGGLSALFGSTAAWLVSIYEFKGRKLLSWMLMLPLAIPSYILGYVFVDVLHYGSPIQTLSYGLLGRYLNPMSLTSAIVLFSLGLYPYVYVVVRSFLARQSATMFDAARLFGVKRVKLFVGYGLPLMRASIISSVVLVLMEVLSDFGLVDYFGIVTFTTLIFGSWFRFRQITTALRFSLWLLVVVFVVLGAERLFSNKKRFAYATTKVRSLLRMRLSRAQQYGAWAYLGGLLLIGFVIPLAQLMIWASQTYLVSINRNLGQAILATLVVALLAGAAILVLTILLANVGRHRPRLLQTILLRITLFGYSVPGAVVAVIMLLLFQRLDDAVDVVAMNVLGFSNGLFLSGTIWMLLSAYVVRFMAIGYQSIESNYQKIGTNFTNASYLLGKGKLATLLSVDVPMLLPGMASAMILVTIDIIKELPLTLVLRPFNFNTLATLTHRYAAEEQVAMGAIAALIMIGLSSVVIYVITRTRKDPRYGR
jgi:iron(III) transport system permease protein